MLIDITEFLNVKKSGPYFMDNDPTHEDYWMTFSGYRNGTAVFSLRYPQIEYYHEHNYRGGYDIHSRERHTLVFNRSSLEMRLATLKKNGYEHSLTERVVKGWPVH